MAQENEALRVDLETVAELKERIKNYRDKIDRLENRKLTFEEISEAMKVYSSQHRPKDGNSETDKMFRGLKDAVSGIS